MPVIGTAGHVDHGKSSLLERLTGKNPMHLQEEYDRGLTIELGFGYWRSPSGKECGIVDVPGHSHFIRNMAGGAFALDAVIFVVAADDGWKPQSEEHLFICNNALIKHGIVVINKCDLVNRERLDDLRDELTLRFENSFLEHAPVVEVSALRGDGISDLEAAMDKLLEGLSAPLDVSKVRIWVDRSFKIGGAGVVITGTLRGGILRTGDMLTHYPGGEKARVRKLEMYGKSIESAQQNNRLAVNLAGSFKLEPDRGSLLTLNFDPKPVREITVLVQVAPTWSSGVRYGGSYLVHIGTRSVNARVYPYLDKKIICGESAVCRLSLAEPIPIEAGERFVMFSSARHGVVGGCMNIISDNLPRSLRHDDELLLELCDDELKTETYSLLRALAQPTHVEDMHVGSLFGKAEIRNAISVLIDKKKIYVLNHANQEFVFESKFFEATLANVVNRIGELRAVNPAVETITTTQLGLPNQLSKSVIAIIMESAATKVQGLKYKNGMLESISASNADLTSSPSARAILSKFRGDISNFPTLKQLYQMFPRDKRIVSLLLQEQALIKLPQDILLPPQILQRLRNDLNSLLLRKSEITVADIKDKWGISRKHAIPLLEYFDSIGVTERREDFRVKGAKFDKS